MKVLKTSFPFWQKHLLRSRLLLAIERTHGASAALVNSAPANGLSGSSLFLEGGCFCDVSEPPGDQEGIQPFPQNICLLYIKQNCQGPGIAQGVRENTRISSAQHLFQSAYTPVVATNFGNYASVHKVLSGRFPIRSRELPEGDNTTYPEGLVKSSQCSSLQIPCSQHTIHPQSTMVPGRPGSKSQITTRWRQDIDEEKSRVLGEIRMTSQRRQCLMN